MKPEPKLCILRGRPGWPPCGRLRSMKSWKNFSNGEAGGRPGICGSALSAPACRSWLLETFTTAGSNSAARSAKLAGAARA